MAKVKKLENWLKSNKPNSQKSPLWEFKSDIFELKDKGYSNLQIQKYLKEVHSFKTSHVAIGNFINKAQNNLNSTNYNKVESKKTLSANDTQTNLSESSEAQNTGNTGNKLYQKMLKNIEKTKGDTK